MDLALNMMNSVLKMMNSVLKMMIFAQVVVWPFGIPGGTLCDFDTILRKIVDGKCFPRLFSLTINHQIWRQWRISKALWVSKSDEFCINYEKLCTKNEELCVKNEECCIKKDEFCRPRKKRIIPLMLRPRWRSFISSASNRRSASARSTIGRPSSGSSRLTCSGDLSSSTDSTAFFTDSPSCLLIFYGVSLIFEWFSADFGLSCFEILSRKLMLTGLLQFIHRGSAEQVLVTSLCHCAAYHGFYARNDGLYATVVMVRQ